MGGAPALMSLRAKDRSLCQRITIAIIRSAQPTASAAVGSSERIQIANPAAMAGSIIEAISPTSDERHLAMPVQKQT